MDSAEQPPAAAAVPARRSAVVRPTWPELGTAALGLWLLSSPATLGHVEARLTISDLACGAILLGSVLMGRGRNWAAWLGAITGLWLCAAPLLFSAPSASAYNNDTLIGALVVSFTLVVPRLGFDEPLTRPPGWSYNPSDWAERIPIVFLALVGFFLSRYMAAFQLGHIATVWDPVFGRQTTQVLTSGVAEAFPISDAGLGAMSYLFDALAGLIGGRRRWRTMPWMVLLFGAFVIPPGATSIVLVILQPIGVGAWCFVCLLTAVVMLLMVPPAIDEVIASVEFLLRTRREGGSWWRALWRGDGSAAEEPAPETPQRPGWRAMIEAVEIVSIPWTLAVGTLLGVWLMAAPASLGHGGAAARGDYIVGALVATVAIVASAEPARGLRFVNVIFGLWLVAAPWWLGGHAAGSLISDVATGVLLIALSLPKGKVRGRYGGWDRFIV